MNAKQMLVDRAVKLLGDPRVMKVMQNPTVMKVAMGAFQLRSKAEDAISSAGQSLAAALKLATRDDVRELRSTVRTLEQSLRQVQSRLEQSNGEKPLAAAPAASVGPGSAPR